MASRRRFSCLLPIVVFVALRALSHAYPTPLPWTSGVFDAEGLDDILQTVRIAYARSSDVGHVPTEVLAISTGRISIAEPASARMAFLSTAQSRAPPSR